MPLMPPPMPPPMLPLMPLNPREDIPEEIPVDPPRLGRLITPLPLNDVPDPLLVLAEGANAPSPREVLKDRTFRNWPMRLPPLGIPSNPAPLPLNPSPLVMILALLRSGLMVSRPIPVTTPELVRLMPMVPRPLPMPRLIAVPPPLEVKLPGALNPFTPEGLLRLLMLPTATFLPSVGPRLRLRTACARGSPMMLRPLLKARPVTAPRLSLRSLTTLVSLKSLKPLISLV